MKTKIQQFSMAIIIVIISISITAYFITHLRLIINVFLRHTDVLYYVKTKRPFVALTIDDGPDPEATSKILDVLQIFGVRATFFLISGNIPSNPTIVKRLVQENHEIGNHLTEDYPSIFLPRETFNRKLVEADTTLQTFKKPVLFRPANAFYRKDMILAGKKNGISLRFR